MNWKDINWEQGMLRVSLIGGAAWIAYSVHISMSEWNSWQWDCWHRADLISRMRTLLPVVVNAAVSPALAFFLLMTLVWILEGFIKSR